MKLTQKAKLIVIIVLAALMTIADSTIYVISVMLDGTFAAGLIYLAWSILKGDTKT